MKGRWILPVLPPLLLLTAFAFLWPGPFESLVNPYVLVSMTFYVAGALLIVKAAGNPIGWLLLIFPLLGSAGALGEATAMAWEDRGLIAAWANTIGAALSTASIVGLPLVMLYFPDGRLPSTRWKVGSRIVVLAGVTGFTAALLNGGWGGDPEDAALTSPIRGITAPAGDIASTLFYVLLLISFFAAGVSLVRRFIGARGRERNQIKWVALAGLVVVLAMVVIFATVGFSTTQGVAGDLLLSLAFATIPIAVSIAILRYRLYEIDRIISRTVSYGLVSAVLIGVYLAAVFVLGRLLPLQGELAVAGSTLLAAALFSPLRRRIQRLVDRRFNRSRFDAERTMEALSRRLSSEVDLLALGRELSAVADQTMQPATVTVWLRDK
jgi:hypothetical protein